MTRPWDRSQVAVDGLAEEVRQLRVAVVPGAGVGEMLFNLGAQTKPFVQLPRQQQPGVGAHSGLTHCVVPPAPARSPREPLFLRALRDYVVVGSPFKTKCGNAARRGRTRITPLLIIVKLKATAAIPRTSSGTGMSVAPCSSNSAVSATTGRDGL